MKDRWYKAALAFVNEQRTLIDLPELEELRPGTKGYAGVCPVSTSIREKRMVVSTLPYLHNVFGSTQIPGDVDIIDARETVGLAYRKRVPIPVDVSHFVKRFDWGYYPDLEVE